MLRAVALPCPQGRVGREAGWSGQRGLRQLPTRPGAGEGGGGLIGWAEVRKVCRILLELPVEVACRGHRVRKISENPFQTPTQTKKYAPSPLNQAPKNPNV